MRWVLEGKEKCARLIWMEKENAAEGLALVKSWRCESSFTGPSPSYRQWPSEAPRIRTGFVICGAQCKTNAGPDVHKLLRISR